MNMRQTEAPRMMILWTQIGSDDTKYPDNPDVVLAVILGKLQTNGCSISL